MRVPQSLYFLMVSLGWSPLYTIEYNRRLCIERLMGTAEVMMRYASAGLVRYVSLATPNLAFVRFQRDSHCVL